MICYLDSSVILRALLGEPGRLRDWGGATEGITSALAEVECLRTLDRLVLLGRLSPDDVAARRESVYHILEALEVVEVGRTVLGRASQPFPTPLGTLEAIHLASAIAWADVHGKRPAFATHDVALGTAARACGFEVLGA